VQPRRKEILSWVEITNIINAADSDLDMTDDDDDAVENVLLFDVEGVQIFEEKLSKTHDFLAHFPS
jgi:hypothetical protein